MVKTQIRLSEDLYSKAKSIAESRDMSLSELICQGLEYVTSVYHEFPSMAETWKPITVKNAGFKVDIDRIDLRNFIDDEIGLES